MISHKRKVESETNTNMTDINKIEQMADESKIEPKIDLKSELVNIETKEAKNTRDAKGAELNTYAQPTVLPTLTPYVINISQTVDKDSIIVETSQSQKKFMFYDRNKNFMGGFSIYEFIKYITSNASLVFLSGVDGDSVRPVIEKYVCSIKRNNSDNFSINMLSYMESPFMGNIETLIKFYTFIYEFEQDRLHTELAKLEQIEANQTLNIFNNMIYCLLNHILKIIAILTQKLEANQLKNTLLNYSVAIVYRLSKFVREEINKKVNDLDTLNQDLLRIEGLRTAMNTKLDSVQKSLDKQNTEIDILLRTTFNNYRNESDSESENLDLKSSSESSPVTSSLDKSNIYNGNSSDINSTPKAKINTESLRVSDLFSELNKLKTFAKSEQPKIQKSIKIDSNLDQGIQSLIQNKIRLPTDSAVSLSDIIDMHSKVKYSSNSNPDFNSYDSGVDTVSNIKYLSSSTPKPNMKKY